jgi:hypothetical protein
MSKKGKSDVINSGNHINQCQFLKLARFLKEIPFDWKKFQSSKRWFHLKRFDFVELDDYKFSWHNAIRISIFFSLKIFQHLSTFNIQNVLFVNWKLDMNIKWHFCFIVHSILDFNRNTRTNCTAKRHWKNPIRMSLTSYFCINTRWIGRVPNQL